MVGIVSGIGQQQQQQIIIDQQQQINMSNLHSFVYLNY